MYPLRDRRDETVRSEGVGDEVEMEGGGTGLCEATMEEEGVFDDGEVENGGVR
jgi:hypothetical protein